MLGTKQIPAEMLREGLESRCRFGMLVECLNHLAIQAAFPLERTLPRHVGTAGDGKREVRDSNAGIEVGLDG